MIDAFPFARCGNGHLGFVTDYSIVRDKEGVSAYRFTGYHIWPLSMFGQFWYSDKPNWIG